MNTGNTTRENSAEVETSNFNTNRQIDRQSNRPFNHKIQQFKGKDDKISISNWLKRYEMLARYYSWDEEIKIIGVGDFLEDEALNWYIEFTNSDTT